MYNTNGLKDDEVKESRKRYGSNSINEILFLIYL